MPQIAHIALLAAFTAGVISFLSPCVLPLVPGYISFVAGRSVNELVDQPAARLPALGLSCMFILGFTSVFVSLGASASWIGHLLLAHEQIADLLGGCIITVFGLLMAGFIRLPFLQKDYRFYARIAGGSPLSAYVLGMAFAFGWTPCIGPVLGAILTVGASGNTKSAIGLLSVYSAGLAVPFLLATLFTGALVQRLRYMGRTGFWLYRVSGIVLMIMGLVVMTGQLSRFSYWLLAAFPVLSRVG
ncbi:cytochrome c biogenesis CcdA family protein [Salinisphaera sp. SWV1]|uniref:cytochrome c biogenesis CcdA family protein n=1 Tax=Salinisphaera sp. SWV1 TaxID=3454139 RepID=UPI003F824B56